MRRYVVSLCVLLCMDLVLCTHNDVCLVETMPENLDCYTNYANHINCWYKASYPGSYTLTLEDKNEYKEPDDTRDLVSSTNNESLNFEIYKFFIDSSSYYRITVQDSSKKLLAAINSFWACCNVKLDPPSNLTYYFNGFAYKISWQGNSEFFGVVDLHCQLQIKKEASGQIITKTIVIEKKKVNSAVKDEEILASEFDEGPNYIQIRCVVDNSTDNIDKFNGRWSEWSSELEIDCPKQTEQVNEKEPKQDFVHIITAVTVPMVILIFLVLALYSSRKHVSFLKQIPTAANFFHPLYHIHNGNFQDWTKHPNKCRENKKEDEHNFPSDIDLYRTTVLYVQKEAVCPVKLESPLLKDDISLNHETCNSTSGSDPLIEKEIHLNGMYPTFDSGFPMFSDDIINEIDTVYSLDYPTDYVSYDGNYIAKSQEVVE